MITDLTGQKFYRLTALALAPKAGKKIAWSCQCDCGASKIVTTSNLRSGQVTSCGCRMVEIARSNAIRRNFIHGHNTIKEKSPTWHSWNSMLKRCRLESHNSYPNYGGRGITICGPWQADFRNFLADMGERPAGTTIDRINNNGNYEPSNCKWSTRSEQQRNKRPFKRWVRA